MSTLYAPCVGVLAAEAVAVLVALRHLNDNYGIKQELYTYIGMYLLSLVILYGLEERGECMSPLSRCCLVWRRGSMVQKSMYACRISERSNDGHITNIGHVSLKKRDSPAPKPVRVSLGYLLLMTLCEETFQ